MIGEIFIFFAIGLIGSAAIWLIIYIVKRFFRFISVVIIGILVFFGIGFFYTGFSGKSESRKEDEQTAERDTAQNEEEEPIIEEPEEEFVQNQAYIYNSLRWSGYNNKRYSIHYQIAVSDLEDAQVNRSNYVGRGWGDIYQNLYENDRHMLSSIYRKYDSLHTRQNTLDFARLVVSSIQEVPYTWVLSESCSDAPNYADIVKSGNECLGNITNYAVQSPAEFMANKKGDCDTKTVALYTILKRFNYDVCIMVSNFYRHAILGINIPASGKYLEYQGKRYYVWETTVKGLDVGLLPPDYSDMSFWEIVL